MVCYSFSTEQTRYKVVDSLTSQKKRDIAYEYIRSFKPVVFGGSFLVALLAYLGNGNNKRK